MVANSSKLSEKTIITIILSPPATASTASPGLPQSGQCMDEGAWNCVDGRRFQRCAAGRWSTPMEMAKGVKCSPGIGKTLDLANR